jgi:hypothetical protein
MSSGRPARPSAVISATRLLTSGLSRTMPPLKSVAIAPGATVLTATPDAPCHGPAGGLRPPASPVSSV